MCCTGMERHLINGHHEDALTKQFIMAQSSLRTSVQKSSFMYLLWHHVMKERDPDTVHLPVYVCLLCVMIPLKAS